MGMLNPCTACGACCAWFRVSFYWAESTGPGGVPADLTVTVSPHRVAMRGTDTRPARCTALAGEVGKGVQCTVYPLRPSPCREFMPSWAGGEANPRCDQARQGWGLPPLSPGYSVSGSDISGLPDVASVAEGAAGGAACAGRSWNLADRACPV